MVARIESDGASRAQSFSPFETKSSVPIMKSAEELHFTVRVPAESMELGMAAPYRHSGVNRIGFTPPYQIAAEDVVRYLHKG